MYPCEIVNQPARPTLFMRFRSTIHDLPIHFQKVYINIMQYVGELGERHIGPAYAAYYNMDMEDLDIEAGFPLNRPLPGKGDIHAGEIVGGSFAVCHYKGPYGEMGPAYDQLTNFLADRGYEAGDIVYEWYLNGPEVPPHDLKTDIAFPVTRITAKMSR